MINSLPSFATSEDQSFSSLLSIHPTDSGKLPLSDMFEEVLIIGIISSPSFSYLFLFLAALLFIGILSAISFFQVDTTATFMGGGFFHFILQI